MNLPKEEEVSKKKEDSTQQQNYTESIKEELHKLRYADYSKCKSDEERAVIYACQISYSATLMNSDVFTLFNLTEDDMESSFLVLVFKQLKALNLINIRTLDMSSMRITDDMMKVICEISWLKALNVPCNDALSDSSIKLISKKLKTLEVLDVSYIKGIKHLQPLMKLKNLKALFACKTSINLNEKQFLKWQLNLESYDFEDTKTKVKEGVVLRSIYRAGNNSTLKWA